MTQPSHAQNPDATAHPTRSGTNVAGIISLIVGAVTLLVGLLFRFVFATAIGSGESSAVSLVSTVELVLTALLGLVALGFGIAGLLAKGRPKASSAAGTALGVAALLGVVGGLLQTVAISVFVG